MKNIEIIFNPLGEGQLSCEGYKTFRCLGKKGLKYPKDLTINPQQAGVKKKVHFSQEYHCTLPDTQGQVIHHQNCPLYFAILIWGQRGIYFHSWPGLATYTANGGETGGCIHLEEQPAELLFNWIDTRTRVLINYPW